MNDAAILWQLAKSFAVISLIAIGGVNAVVPAMRQEIVDRLGWMDDATFMQLYAMTQVTPGPNILIVSLIGWQMAALPGLIIATLAMLLPACTLAFFVGKLAVKLSDTRSFKMAQHALVPLAVGLIIAAGLDMAQAAAQHWLYVFVTAVSAAMILLTKVNPVWTLVCGAGLVLGASLFGFPG
jgi:chromate transporter